MPPDLEALLIEQIRAAKRNWRNGGLTMIVLMGVLGAISYFGLGGREGTGLAALSGFGAFVGALLLLPSLGDPAKAKILSTLRARSASIVWLYVFTQRGQAAASWIIVGLDDGKRERVPAILGREQEVLTAMTRLAPKATVGFTPALDALFRRTPVELRRP